jgi:hypothetical protein
MRIPPLPSQQHSQVASSIPNSQDVALQQARTTAQKEVAQFRGLIQTMQQAGVDISSYQQQYSTDQTMFRNAKLVADFKNITQQLQSQMTPSTGPLAKALAKYLVQEFHQEATDWERVISIIILMMARAIRTILSITLNLITMVPVQLLTMICKQPKMLIHLISTSPLLMKRTMI